MANTWQLALLKLSIVGWNKWREIYPKVHGDLSGADLRKLVFKTQVWVWEEDIWIGTWITANLSGVDLSGTDLTGVDLDGVDLSNANLSNAKLENAILAGANLSRAKLSGADLTKALLRKTDLSGATLDGARLRWANLSFANLEEASLYGSDLLETNFSYGYTGKCNFAGSKAYMTIFGSYGLGKSLGLDTVIHGASSPVTTYALLNSMGKISEIFLRGCGLSDWEIEQAELYNPSLTNDEINRTLYRIYDLRAKQALQISPLFISYSHGDGVFVDNIERKLDKKGIRFWRDIHEMKAGRIETQIDRAISQNRTVLLILSEHSIKSDWVEHEVRTARALEKDMGRDVLCPIALDDSWKSSPWPKRVMEQIMEYNILDFSAWQDDVKFEGMFRKLIDGLELFYKDKSHGE